MKSSEPFVITISHMLGSGGAYIGQKLNILYLDREIVSQVAKKLYVSEEEIYSHDEKTDSLWESIYHISRIINESVYKSPRFFIPSDRLVFDCETEIIERTANEHSVVILGRGASHILHNHPYHISVFLHGYIDFRKNRIQKLYDLSDKEAIRMIAEYDKKRSHHYKVFTGHEFSDSSQYTICLDTSKVGIEESSEIILKYAEERFGVVPVLN